MHLIAQKSNESPYGTHQVHLNDCPKIQDLEKDDTFTFLDFGISILEYPEAVQKAKGVSPGFNVIPCPECLKMSDGTRK